MDEDKVLGCVVDNIITVNAHINEITSLLHKTAASARGLKHLNSIAMASKKLGVDMNMTKSLVATVMSNSALEFAFNGNGIIKEIKSQQKWTRGYFDLFYQWVTESYREINLAVSNFNTALNILKELHRIQFVFCSGAAHQVASTFVAHLTENYI